MKPAFLTTQRLCFCQWEEKDKPLAEQLWGNPQVTRWITASGRMSPLEIQQRLSQEIQRQQEFGVQYWPVLERESGRLVGCCGLRPHGDGELELGVHLLPEFWGKGLAEEACRTALWYGFFQKDCPQAFAGHNPGNTASPKLLKRLGFVCIGTEFYPPTGLEHPSYRLQREEFHIQQEPLLERI